MTSLEEHNTQITELKTSTEERCIFDSPTPTTVLTELDDDAEVDFTKQDDLADVILAVGEKKLYSYRSVLAIASPVFKKMFQGDVKMVKTKTINLAGKTFEAVHEMLCWMVPSVHRHITADTAELVLPLADEYQVTKLKQECEEVLLNRLKRATCCASCVHYLILSEKHGLSRMNEMLLDHLCCLSMDQLELLPGVSNVSHETLVRILTRRVRCLELSPQELAAKESKDKGAQIRYSHLSSHNKPTPNENDGNTPEEAPEVVDRDTVLLLVENEEIPVCRTLLTTASPVFQSMLCSPFREGRSRDITLPGKSHKAVQFMVDFISSPDALPITDELLEPVLLLANEYFMGKLKSVCEQFIVDDLRGSADSMVNNNKLRYLRLAHQCRLPAVTKALVTPLSKIPSIQLDSCSNYDNEAMLPVLKARVKFLENELLKRPKSTTTRATTRR